MWEVLDTAKRVAEKSQFVGIDKSAVRDLAIRCIRDRVEIPSWDPRIHFTGEGAGIVAYVLVLDSLNFCFWPTPGKKKWAVQAQWGTISGYPALALVLKQALERGMPITEARYLERLTVKDLRAILNGEGDLQLMEHRREILNELGGGLRQRYRGRAERLVESAESSALKLARTLAREFSSFRDVSKYHGETVYFYKRAQIVAADLYGAFEGQNWGNFKDMDRLTAFADYKLPQVLRHLGALRYSPPLALAIDRMEFLSPGSIEEVEIRANTIWAVELLRRELLQLGKEYRAFEIDWILWNLGQREEFKQKPYHRTLTIFY